MSDYTAKNEIRKPPILIIGCGGTGLRVVRMLKAKYREEFEGSLATLDNLPIELLGIDTLPAQESRGTAKLDNDDYLSLGPVQLDRFIQYHFDKETFIKKWFNPNQYAGLMATGAMQIRAFGRLALFLNVQAAEQVIDTKIRNVANKCNLFGEETEKANYRVKTGASIQVHIVGNIGGGTGSGTMLDVAYLVRNTCKFPVTLIAHLVMPEIIANYQIKDSIYANAYAFLKELDNFNVQPEIYGWSSIAKYLKAKENIDYEEKNTHRPFDYVNLLSPFTYDSSCLDETFLLNVVAEKIFLCSMNEIGDRELERLVNIQTDTIFQPYQTEDMPQGKPCAYSSYGVSVLRVKKKAIRQRVENYYLEKMINFLKANDTQIDVKETSIDMGTAEVGGKKEGASAKKPANAWHFILSESIKHRDANQLLLNGKPETFKAPGKEWFVKQTTSDRKLIDDNDALIRKWLIKEWEKARGLGNVRIVTSGKMPEPRLLLPSDYDSTVQLTGKDMQTFSIPETFKTWLHENAKFNLIAAFEERCKTITNEFRGLISWASQKLKGTEATSLEGTPQIDSILFFNFPIDKLTSYMERYDKHFGREGDQDFLEVFDPEENGAGSKTSNQGSEKGGSASPQELYVYNPSTDVSHEKLEARFTHFTEHIWKNFSELYRTQEGEQTDKRLTVNNFIRIMFEGDYERLNELLATCHAISAPCWRYNDHFKKYIKTISLIGSRHDNKVYEKLNGWDFYGSTLEGTKIEEDPFQIPIVVSQHGLPLLGYDMLREYKKSYQLMRKKFSKGGSRFERQFHLDKRWEEKEEKDDILIDPFEDMTASINRHIKGQLFVFCWYLGMVRENNNKYFIKFQNGQEERLNPASEHSPPGPAVALERFFKVLEREHALESMVAEEVESIQERMGDASTEREAGVEAAPDTFSGSLEIFKQKLEGVRTMLMELKSPNRWDILTMCEFIEYVKSYEESGFRRLSEMRSDWSSNKPSSEMEREVTKIETNSRKASEEWVQKKE